jgi:Uma2 family endonuclease
MDSLTDTRAKMLEYMINGARLGWLVDPDRGCIEVYRPGHAPETTTVASGYDILTGLELRIIDLA